ncbi:MAG TPA: SMP-30/gluconolactonase/LRE family protein [Prolixibacteraceae bacterium]
MRTKSCNTTNAMTKVLSLSLVIRFLMVIMAFSMFHSPIFAKEKGKSLIAKGAKPEKLADGFKFTEGPAVDSKGNVFFTDQPNNQILKWSTDNKLSLFKENYGRANGLYFDKKGNLISCSDEKDEVWSIAPDGKVTVLVKDFEGKKLNGPNDLWIAPNGGIYLTDPFYKRPWWDHELSEQDGEHVYYLAPGASKLIRVVTDLEKPNGIIGTPDGKCLYVADIKANKTWRYSINSDGTLTGKKLFAELGSDGMTIDNKGDIYLTGKGVTIFNPDGVLIENIPIPESWTANVCFGGKDRHLLFITASKSIYGIKMKVKGVR